MTDNGKSLTSFLKPISPDLSGKKITGNWSLMRGMIIISSIKNKHQSLYLTENKFNFVRNESSDTALIKCMEM